jgi:hypothetical protein
LRLGELAEQELERDALLQDQVLRREDGAHPSAAQQALDGVLARDDVAR